MRQMPWVPYVRGAGSTLGYEVPEVLEHRRIEHLTTEHIAVGALGDLNGFKVDRARLEI